MIRYNMERKTETAQKRSEIKNRKTCKNLLTCWSVRRIISPSTDREEADVMSRKNVMMAMSMGMCMCMCMYSDFPCVCRRNK